MAKAQKQRIVKFVSPTDGTVFHLDADTLEFEAYQAEGAGPVRPVEDAQDGQAEQSGPGEVVSGSEAGPGEPPAPTGDEPAPEEDESDEPNPFALW